MTIEYDKQDYRLISGVFLPDEAQHMLMTLFEEKISFHRKNIWSRQERFGKKDVVGTRRIGELTKTKADLATLIEGAQCSGQRLAINCTIEITLVPE